MSALTRRQADLLDYLKSYIGAKGYAPSYQEMTDALGLHSKSGTHRLVDALEERGFIKRIENRARAIEIVENPTLHTVLNLKRYTNATLAKEAKRRGLVLGHIQERFVPESNVVTRVFEEVRA